MRAGTRSARAEGPRRFVLRRQGQQQGIVAVAFKSPPARSSYFPALEVLTQVLSCGKQSRLHRALVDGGLAQSAACFVYDTRDNGLLVLHARLVRGATHEDAEAAAEQADRRSDHIDFDSERNRSNPCFEFRSVLRRTHQQLRAVL